VADKGNCIVHVLLPGCSIAIESDIVGAAGITGMEQYLFVENRDEPFGCSAISPGSRRRKINEQGLLSTGGVLNDDVRLSYVVFWSLCRNAAGYKLNDQPVPGWHIPINRVAVNRPMQGASEFLLKGLNVSHFSLLAMELEKNNPSIPDPIKIYLYDWGMSSSFSRFRRQRAEKRWRVSSRFVGRRLARLRGFEPPVPPWHILGIPCIRPMVDNGSCTIGKGAYDHPNAA